MSNIFQNQVSFEVDQIPMDEAQTIDLGTTESDRVFYPEKLLVICEEAPSILGLMALSVGTNASSYNNVVAASLVAGLTVADKLLTLNPPAGPVLGVPGGSALKAKVSVPATSGGVMRLILVGFYGNYPI
jgi:hypothetical protein